MPFLRSERFSAAILLIAAALGLLLANLPFGGSLIDARDAELPLPGTRLELSTGHWISDGLLAVFFLLVAIELRHELTHGELASPTRALVPAIAAAGGVAVPAAIYLAIAGPAGYAVGWPVPTATDIAFALGVLAVFGRGLPGRVRAFLLALAVLDDLVAILIIAVFFSHDVELILLVGAVVAVAGFGFLSRLLRTRARIPVAVAMGALALIAWYFTYRSGVHATIAGVALGLVMSPRPAGRLRHTLEPYSNGVILPLFAFSAALVAIPAVSISELAPPFWGIAVALPFGKLLGIAVAGGAAVWLSHRRGKHVLQRSELAAVGVLGGIGFTVSLLMNELAFARVEEVEDEGTLAVLVGSAVSIAASAIVVSRVSKRARAGISPAGDPRPTR